MSKRPETFTERYDHLKKVLQSKWFLEKQGLGNEVPFFICPYPPAEAFKMEAGIDTYLTKPLAQQGITALHLNLYDLSIEILKEADCFEQILEEEPHFSKDELMEILQNTLDSESALIPKIAEKTAEQPFDILFLSGVGEVFPYIRSHNVLNNLQSTVKEQPTVLFFPGEYSHSKDRGRELNLFGIMVDDEYYRAFNIFDYQV